jgi:hypothetical protein
LLGRVGPEYSFDWPAGRGDEYAGEFSLILGSTVYNPLLGREVISVLTTQSPARGRDEVNPANPAEYWTLAPLPGLAADTGLVALSTQPWSWPASWPDTDAAGWNSGLADGARTAAQEAYFWQDDNRDHEFLATEYVSREEVEPAVWLHYFPENPAGADVALIQPHPGDELHGGLGLKIATRAYEWSEPALQDLLLLTYDIHNTGRLPLEDSRLGLVLGTFVGGEGDQADDRHFFNKKPGAPGRSYIATRFETTGSGRPHAVAVRPATIPGCAAGPGRLAAAVPTGRQPASRAARRRAGGDPGGRWDLAPPRVGGTARGAAAKRRRSGNGGGQPTGRRLFR